MMPVMVSEAARLSHARKRPQRAVMRAPPSSGKRSSSASQPWSSISVTGPRAPAAPNSDHRLGAVRAPKLGAGRPHRAPRRRRDLEHDALLHRPLRRSVHDPRRVQFGRRERLPPSAPAPRSRAPDHPASSPPRAPRRGRAGRGPATRTGAAFAASGGHQLGQERGGPRRRQGTPRRRRSSGALAWCALRVSAFGDRGQHRRDAPAAAGTSVSKLGRGRRAGDAPSPDSGSARSRCPRRGTPQPPGRYRQRRPVTRCADLPGPALCRRRPTLRHCVCWKLEGCRGGANNWGWGS